MLTEEFCELFNINDQNVERKTGEECFYLKGEKLNFNLKDFWSWNQSELSNISFSIRPTKGWNSKTNESDSESKRQAEVYVFCLLNHKDKVTVDPLNLEQWEFYISYFDRREFILMKKLFLGGLLFIGGLISILIFIILSVANPCICNGIGGFKGFLIMYNLTTFFVIFSILSLVGIIICVLEVYKKK